MKTKEKMKVFVVDDDIFRTYLYEQHLVNLGFKDISIYHSGTSCLNALTEEPDIIFLDYHMDDMNGLEVLQKIKRFNPNIYVVLISGQQSMEVAVKSLKIGAFDYIIKEEEELNRIEEVVEKIIKVNTLLQEKNNPKPSRVHSLVGIMLIAAIICGFVYQFLQ
ncbi:response regulator [Fulvivirga sediminis]|uniref:Response regulator n=1 Tax=Fulvivirga sediminis TaxID=2803949 RepID=A0A937FA78_9BACT|nr:response regulator [Fulvivirga sediminis]MBL3656778.1 response regulator [Fulvivirga sediminis]